MTRVPETLQRPMKLCSQGNTTIWRLISFRRTHTKSAAVSTEAASLLLLLGHRLATGHTQDDPPITPLDVKVAAGVLDGGVGRQHPRGGQRPTFGQMGAEGVLFPSGPLSPAGKSLGWSQLANRSAPWCVDTQVSYPPPEAGPGGSSTPG